MSVCLSVFGKCSNGNIEYIMRLCSLAVTCDGSSLSSGFLMSIGPSGANFLEYYFPALRILLLRRPNTVCALVLILSLKSCCVVFFFSADGVWDKCLEVAKDVQWMCSSKNRKRSLHLLWRNEKKTVPRDDDDDATCMESWVFVPSIERAPPPSAMHACRWMQRRRRAKVNEFC